VGYEVKITDKALQMGKTSTIGSIQSFLGVSISTVILAVGTIVLGIYIIPGDYGLYAVALIPISTLSIFQDWGIGSALTRYCAKYRATNEEAEQRKVIIAGLAFGATTGLILTIVSLLLANFFAISIYNKPAASILISLASVTIFSSAINSANASIFTGFEQMKLNSYLSVIFAVVQGVLSALLVFFGFGAIGAIIGYTTAVLVQTIFSIVFLYSSIFRKLPRIKTEASEVCNTLKMLLRYSIPLGIGSVVGSIGGPIFSFLMASYVNEATIGNYKIATNFTILLTFITTPIANVLFPAFSKVDPRKENNLLKTLFASSVKYTNLFLTPATLALIILATPLIGTLYGNKWPEASLFLTLGISFYLLSLSGLRSVGSLLSAVGETKLLLKQSLLSLVIAIPVAFLLVPSLGIIGIIVGLPIAALPSAFIGLYASWKKYGAKADFVVSAKILLSSGLAAATVYLFFGFFHASYLLLLVTGLILFLVVYIISVPLFGAINQWDVNNLRTMFSSSSIISKPMEVVLKILEKLLRTRENLEPKH
jgi:O-antigen/teichoic acid export membrane protein